MDLSSSVQLLRARTQGESVHEVRCFLQQACILLCLGCLDFNLHAASALLSKHIRKLAPTEA
jgi:uncharacterized iron-regulated membrane protein